MAAVENESPQSLKKLGFVPEAGARGYEIASTIYTTAKTYVPASLQPRLDKVEESVTNVSAPYIAKAHDKGAELLRLADDQVDRAVVSATHVYEKNSAYLQAQIERQKSYHAGNLQTYRAAREHYLGVVEQSVEYLRANGLPATARVAADEVGRRVAAAREAPAYLLRRVQSAVEALLTQSRSGAGAAAARARPAIDAAYARAKPALDAAYGRYVAVHDNVVGSPRYAKAVELGQTALARAQTLPLYVRGRDAIYPLLAPYAEPAYARVEPIVQRVQAHLAPKAVVA